MLCTTKLLFQNQMVVQTILLFFLSVSLFLYILRYTKNHRVTKHKAAEEARCERALTQRDFQCRWNWLATFASLFFSCQIGEVETKRIQRKHSKRKLCKLPSHIHKTHFPMISWTAEQSALSLPLSL